MAETYDGTEGDAALAAGMDVLDGTEDWRDGWRAINKARDYIATRIAAVLATIWPVAFGGTGASTAEQARTNLQVPWTTATGLKFSSTQFDRITVEAPGVAFQHQIAWLTDIPAGGNFLPISGGTVTGAMAVNGTFYLPNLVGVNSNYVAMYRNGDGRVGLTPSARRFKRDIVPHNYTLAEALRIQPVNYRLTPEAYGGKGAPLDIGVIAEDLVSAGLAEFVVFDEDGQPLTVHYERLVLVTLGAVRDLAELIRALQGRR